MAVTHDVLRIAPIDLDATDRDDQLGVVALPDRSLGLDSTDRSVASALGFRHIDTGAMYRAVGWLAAYRGLPLDDEAAIAALAEQAPMEIADDRITIEGHDVTKAIRTPEIDGAATRVARLPSVVVCAYDVTSLPGPLLLQGGLECHPMTFRRGRLRSNEHYVPAERFLEELSAGPE